MRNPVSQSDKRLYKDGSNVLVTILVSVFALISTFAISNLPINFQYKLLIFTIITVFYLTLLFLLFRYKNVTTQESGISIPNKEIYNDKIEEKLLVLEEASKFFGASLKFADIFRLVANRINELVEYDTCVLFLIEDQNKILGKIAVGENSGDFDQIAINLNEGLTGKSFLSKKLEIDPKLFLESKYLPTKLNQNFKSAASVPLSQAGKIYGFINLYSKSESFFDESKQKILEAVAVRISPLINSSIIFEKGISNAMTDNLTNLPNERAFFMILENQIAKAQRFQNQKSLAVLAIDIKNFDNINQKFGHSTGDKVLSYTAEQIKLQLRKMDFISRTFNDEFLILLPTSTKEFTIGIVKRIKMSFDDKPFTFGDDQICPIELCFGSSGFGIDGETAEELIKLAKLRKTQTKTGGENRVIFFPKQYVN